MFNRLTDISPRSRPNAGQILEDYIFFRFKFNFEKFAFEQRYFRVKKTDLGRFSFVVADEKANKNNQL